MEPVTLATVELDRHDWSSLREIAGTAQAVPEAIRGLLHADDPDEVSRYYWKLENRVVAQRALYESALHVVPVLLAALTADRAPMVTAGILDLLLEIVAGEAAQEEVAVGNGGLGDACRAAARQGLWLIYRELWRGKPGYGPSDTAREILDRLEPDGDRLAAVIRAWVAR